MAEMVQKAPEGTDGDLLSGAVADVLFFICFSKFTWKVPNNPFDKSL